MNSKKINIIISGGGTGGHIFPAIAIADAIKKLRDEVEILFVGAKDGMEVEKVTKAGYRIETLWISGVDRKFSLRNFLFPLKLMTSLVKAGFIIDKFRPAVAVGVGGYASGPLLYQSAKRKIPCLIQEQNSYPGVTNKLLAPKAKKICLGMNEAEKYFPKQKCIYTGNPVRKDIAKGDREEALKYFNLNSQKKTLFIMGGSLGAGTINRALIGGIKNIQDKNFQMLWQTGKSEFDEVNNSVTKNDSLKIFPFIDRMDLAYSIADVVISRAGALSLSELSLVAKPAILVPSPNVTEDHQTKNAKALADKNSAVMIRDADAQEKLIASAIELLNDENKRNELSKNILSFAKPDASEVIAKEVLLLVKD